MGSMMQDRAFAIPGVDKAMSFPEIMKHVKISPLSLLSIPLSFDIHTATTHSFLRIIFNTASFPIVPYCSRKGPRKPKRVGEELQWDAWAGWFLSSLMFFP
jgi:hypothetical protein